VRYSGTYKVAYYAFALEAACGGSGNTHHRVIIQKTMDWFGVTPTKAEIPRTTPVAAGYALHPNYPNPFNPSTYINFETPKRGQVTLRVYDIQGRQVATLMDRDLFAGPHTVMFDGTGFASGVYLVRMQAENFSDTQRMLLVK
jgi:hypothetical protein